jgi:hypothetical protein
MDANGVTFWMLSEGAQFEFTDGKAVWDRTRRVLRLASQRPLPDLPVDKEAAAILADQAPATLDAFGTFAALSTDRTQVLASGVLETALPIFSAAAGQKILDLCMGEDGVLYLAVGIPGTAAAVIMVDGISAANRPSLPRKSGSAAIDPAR